MFSLENFSEFSQPRQSGEALPIHYSGAQTKALFETAPICAVSSLPVTGDIRRPKIV
jgi:hypothetical protein